VLQCVLQCVADHQKLHLTYVCAAVCCSVFAVCCSLLQCVAVCCMVLHCITYRWLTYSESLFFPHRNSSSNFPCVCVCASVCVCVCCSVLQCVALCCSVLQCVVVCCSVLQCVTVLQCVAKGNILVPRIQRVALSPPLQIILELFLCVCVRVLQYVAVCCSGLQCYSVLQRVTY